MALSCLGVLQGVTQVTQRRDGGMGLSGQAAQLRLLVGGSIEDSTFFFPQGFFDLRYGLSRLWGSTAWWFWRGK